MAIKGLTDRKEGRFPILGKIHKGGPKEKRLKNGKEFEVYGKDLDHYRFVSDDPVMTRRFAEIYPGTPDKIFVQLPFASTDQNFSAWKECWTGTALQHRCDGVETVLSLQKDGKYSDKPEPCPGGCKEVGRLNVFIREMGRIGLVTVETHSKHDIINIHGLLAALEAGSANKSLTGIPLVLTRKLTKISSVENGQRKVRQKYLIHVEPEPQWAELLIAAQATAALPEAPAALQLVSGDAEEVTVDVSDIEPPTDEYYGEAEPEPEYLDEESADEFAMLWTKYSRPNPTGELQTVMQFLRSMGMPDIYCIPKEQGIAWLTALRQRAQSAQSKVA